MSKHKKRTKEQENTNSKTLHKSNYKKYNKYNKTNDFDY